MSRTDTADGDAYSRALERLDARVDWERRDRSKGWRVDLAPVRDLVERLGRPDRAYRCVHVAGTKGKGSVCSLVAEGLRRSGLRVGVYGSPHVESIRERIRIDGELIPEAAFAAAAHTVVDELERAERDGTDAGEASWFDAMTAIAMTAFRDAGVDVAVLEVGLGGRLDSTNVIDVPEVCAITSIALEHTAILGNTHAKIAREKAGVIKPGGVAVSGCDPTSEAGRVIAEVAQERGAELVGARDPGDVTFEERNVRIALAVLDRMDGVSGSALTGEGIRTARLPGRMERRSYRGVDLVVDGAHVRESIAEAVRDAPAIVGRDAAPVVLVAIHAEKDVPTLLGPIAERAALIVATSIPWSRVHLSADEVTQRARTLGIGARAVEDPTEALEEAARLAQERDTWILAIGSLYLAGAIGPALDPRD